MDQEQAAGLEPTWAVVGLFGHTTIAGRISTVTLGGSVLIKIEVPETVRILTKNGYFDNRRYGPKYRVETFTPAYTRMFGVGAIYSLDPCDEQEAKNYAKRISPPDHIRVKQTETCAELPPPADVDIDLKGLGDGTPREDLQSVDNSDEIPACSQCGSEDVELCEDSEEGNYFECNHCGHVERTTKTIAYDQTSAEKPEAAEPTPDAPAV